MAKLIWRYKQEQRVTENIQTLRWEHSVRPKCAQRTIRVWPRARQPGWDGKSWKDTNSGKELKKNTQKELSTFIKSKGIKALNSHTHSYTSYFIHTYETHTLIHTNTYIHTPCTHIHTHTHMCVHTHSATLQSATTLHPSKTYINVSLLLLTWSQHNSGIETTVISCENRYRNG